MTQVPKTSRSRKKMAILAGYFEDETYGLLGPQMAATIIRDQTPYDCIVIAVTREYDKDALKKVLNDFFAAEKPVIGFSSLSGRQDLFELAKEFKDEGAVTLLAGPQANVDFAGEEDWQNHPHRFHGFSDSFNFALHGPAEQAIELLNFLDKDDWAHIPGLSYIDSNGSINQNPSNDWNSVYLGKVQWDNIYKTTGEGIAPLKISLGQVLQHIGCPHATRSIPLEVDYPVSLDKGQEERIELRVKGCSFCDVAIDKEYFGILDMETVISQIHCLPEAEDGRKIPFELINENPLPTLPNLLQEINLHGLNLSQINLTLRADWFIKGHQHLKEALRIASETGVYLLISSIGFESFDDTILRNLNKGLSVKQNLDAIRLVRKLKKEFPDQMGYSTREGANHGFIHPTPWDTNQTEASNQKNISLYGLQNDILPPHSTPLIIHHASALAHWIRKIESSEKLRFKRYGSIIGWWEGPQSTLTNRTVS
jgi:hypothetical protein